nr:MAG TPA: hypothetical protein [Caudoviricetes sp.]
MALKVTDLLWTMTLWVKLYNTNVLMAQEIINEVLAKVYILI